eukprot:5953671-Amphidinium_carterae.1
MAPLKAKAPNNFRRSRQLNIDALSITACCTCSESLAKHSSKKLKPSGAYSSNCTGYRMPKSTM